MTLPAFAKQVAGPLLQPVGFRLRRGTFERTTDGVRQVASFMKYHGTPHFNVRLQVVLAPFYPELGVVASSDLSHLIVPAERYWPWPPAHSTSSEVAAAVMAKAIPWLDAIQTPRLLAAYLEERRVFSETVDAALAKSVAAFSAAGIQALYQSPGFFTPRAGRVRPDTVRALSFCYEICGDWAASLQAWDEYCGTWETPLPSEHRLAIANAERRRYLQAQGAADESINDAH